MILPVMFSYYGAKWRVAKLYPAPRYTTLYEPFAGSACYALHHPHKQVVLYDINPKVCGVWDFLIKAKEEEIRRLPVNVFDLNELDLPQEAKWFIGFWLAKASTHPRNKPSAWNRKGNRRSRGYWGASVRGRVAEHVRYIRHWKVVNASYETIPDVEATYFVDPPYVVAGKSYKYHDIDYKKLGEWCQSRKGQVIACEGPGADWLPFRVLTHNNSAIPRKGKAVFKHEMVWHKSDLRVGFKFC